MIPHLRAVWENHELNEINIPPCGRMGEGVELAREGKFNSRKFSDVSISPWLVLATGQLSEEKTQSIGLRGGRNIKVWST